GGGNRDAGLEGNLKQSARQRTTPAAGAGLPPSSTRTRPAQPRGSVCASAGRPFGQVFVTHGPHALLRPSAATKVPLPQILKCVSTPFPSFGMNNLGTASPP